MKHIQKDYKVKMYIPRESANQNVAIVGERNDEDHAVPSVMKLLEKLTDEDVDEMILERRQHSALSRSWTYQFLRSQKESWKLSQHSTGTNPRQDTHTKWWRKIVKDSQSRAASCERTGCKDYLEP